MSASGFQFTGLRVSNHGRPDAEVRFGPGFNVIAGASGTGKSYILQCLEFVLGSSKVPANIPESRDYTSAFVGILQNDKKDEFTLRRALTGGDIELYKLAFDKKPNLAPDRILAAKPSGDDKDNISALLLDLVGLSGKKIRKNTQNAVNNLTFWYLSNLCFISEERILSRESPVRLNDKILDTAQVSTFRLLLTGLDDSATVASENPKLRKARLNGQLDLLEEMLVARKKDLASFHVEPTLISQEIINVQREMVLASETTTTLEKELEEYEKIRKEAWEKLQPVQSRRIVLAELLNRFELLQQHYNSDLSRLEAMIEAGFYFAQLPSVDCPMCGAVPAPDRRSHAGEIETFRSACEQEIKKIRTLSADLQETRNGLLREDSALSESAKALKATYDSATKHLEEMLQPKVSQQKASWSDLAKRLSELHSAALFSKEVDSLTEQLAGVVAQLKKKNPRPQKSPSEVAGRTVVQLCSVMEGLLKKWRYPMSDRVSFDNTKLDFVVDTRDRGAQGKGYRALLYSAFVIALMKFCKSEGMPHPGVVILDSPLVTLQEPDANPDDVIDSSIKEAFYESLSEEAEDNQIIVLENDEPPTDVRARINYLHFTGVPGLGRSGFFPIISS